MTPTETPERHQRILHVEDQRRAGRIQSGERTGRRLNIREIGFGVARLLQRLERAGTARQWILHLRLHEGDQRRVAIRRYSVRRRLRLGVGKSGLQVRHCKALQDDKGVLLRLRHGGLAADRCFGLRRRSLVGRHRRRGEHARGRDAQGRNSDGLAAIRLGGGRDAVHRPFDFRQKDGDQAAEAHADLGNVLSPRQAHREGRACRAAQQAPHKSTVRAGAPRSRKRPARP